MLNLNFLRSFLISKQFIQKIVGSSILIDLNLVKLSGTQDFFLSHAHGIIKSDQIFHIHLSSLVSSQVVLYL